MYQPQVFSRKVLWVGSRVDVHSGEGEYTGVLPLFNDSLVLWGPHQIRLIGRAGALIRHRNVIVWTPDLVLGTVATLRERLVTSNVPTFATWLVSEGQNSREQALVDRHRYQRTRSHSPCGTWCGYIRRMSVRYVARNLGSERLDLPATRRATAGTSHCAKLY